MSLLAVWFPPNGTFGIVLTVGGVIVSLLAFAGWKRVLLVSTCVLLGIGDLVSIHKTEEAHIAEVRNQHRDTEKLEVELRNSETQRRIDAAIVQTKLEDYAALSPLVRAIMKLAETGAQSEKRMVDTKGKNDRDLYARTMSLAKEIREFSKEHDQIEEQQREQAVRLAHGLQTPSDMLIDDMNRSRLLSHARTADFLKVIWPDAAYLRNELLKSRLKPPSLDPTDKAIVNAALTRGSLVGPYPELKVAAYLELWVKPLAGKASARSPNLESKLSRP